MGSADHRSIDELLAGYVLGDLEEAEQRELRTALAQDPSLQTQIDELRVTLELLPLAIPADVAPPPRLRRRLLKQQNGAAPAAEGAPGRESAARIRRPVGGRIVLAAMTGALMVLGVQVMQLRGEVAHLRSIDPGVAGPAGAVKASRTMVLRGTAGHGGISGEVVVNAGTGYNILRIQGLPAPPPNHVYRLWADVDGKSVGCVNFVPDADGSVAMPIPTEPSSHARALSISLEPLQPDGAVPEGPRVLTSV